MMSTTELLQELIASRVNALAAEHGLTAAETERILLVFRQAIANPFMSEEHIYHKLSGQNLSGQNLTGQKLSEQNPSGRDG